MKTWLKIFFVGVLLAQGCGMPPERVDLRSGGSKDGGIVPLPELDQLPKSDNKLCEFKASALVDPFAAFKPAEKKPAYPPSCCNATSELSLDPECLAFGRP